jgi:BCD family chlorophyll transporter-like MFS transporter
VTPLGWLGIVRLGLVQTALGAIVVLTTSTLNRVMVVELALPALVPGLLVALHYAVQVIRPRVGHGSDVGGRRTPWIVGGMAVLAVGGVMAALGTALAASDPVAGVALAALGFIAIGVGVGASGTTLLVLLSTRVEARRRPAAATIVWVMMIFGFTVTAITAGRFLDPFSPERMVMVSAVVSVVAFLLATVAVRGVEGPGVGAANPDRPPPAPFRRSLAQVWAEPRARRFTIFVFVSMFAYNAQDLILEPFAGLVFGFTPGQSTQLAGAQHGGVMIGMILVALLGSGLGGRWFGSLTVWIQAGCLGSALGFALLTASAFAPDGWPITATVAAVGFANGMFAVAAIATMMALVRRGQSGREGMRMGIWGAAQAIAFGLGGFTGSAAVDVARWALASDAVAFAAVFAGESLLFLVAALLAVRLHDRLADATAAPTDGVLATGLNRG